MMQTPHLKKLALLNMSSTETNDIVDIFKKYQQTAYNNL